ncbi:MAG: hypothetical protein H6654_17630 [Ardenticatenaceae bacterium]|nr:hypothetical protein [Ardenticatenaceae bacterium]
MQDGDGQTIDAAGLQIPGVLDDLYPTMAIWRDLCRWPTHPHRLGTHGAAGASAPLRRRQSQHRS